MNAPALDLVVLVADADQKAAIAALLDHRSESLGVRRIKAEILKHPRRDPGCFNEGPAVLQTFLNRAAHCLLVLDHEGSGQDDRPAAAVESDMLARLAGAGWEERAAVVVIAPELEIWVWSDSPHVDEALGWKGQRPDLRTWLDGRGLWPRGQLKPRRPKEALEAALRERRAQRSPALYASLAKRVGLERCGDPTFLRLRAVLRGWFPLMT